MPYTTNAGAIVTYVFVVIILLARLYFNHQDAMEYGRQYSAHILKNRHSDSELAVWKHSMYITRTSDVCISYQVLFYILIMAVPSLPYSSLSSIFVIPAYVVTAFLAGGRFYMAYIWSKYPDITGVFMSSRLIKAAVWGLIWEIFILITVVAVQRARKVGSEREGLAKYLPHWRTPEPVYCQGQGMNSYQAYSPYQVEPQSTNYQNY